MALIGSYLVLFGLACASFGLGWYGMIGFLAVHSVVN